MSIDKKKKGPRGWNPRLVFATRILILALIAFVIGKTIYDRLVPFESTPSFSVDFQQEDNQYLRKFHIEKDCFPAYNGEKQCYQAENVSIGERGLVLKAVYVGNDENGEPIITSGRVDTRGFFTQSCGRYEITAKFPSGIGVFPAIWLREPDWLQADPSRVNPAVNIAEFQGGMNDKVHFNLHTHLSLENEEISRHSKSVTIENFADTFHTFSLEWTDTSIKYFVDGVWHHTVENTGNGDWIDGPTELILNLAMGGRWAEAVASRQNLTTWHGIQLKEIGQEWEVVNAFIYFYPLRNKELCS